jgi:hypothetical protein
MIRVDICDASQQPYDSYNDPDTTKRHVRKAGNLGAFLSLYSNDPLLLVVEVDGVNSTTKEIDRKAPALYPLQELLASARRHSSSFASRLIGFTASSRTELSEITEFRVILKDPSNGSLRGTIMFKLQEEAEFDSVYGDRVKARPARPDAPQFTTDATSIEDGVSCWHCRALLAAGSTHCTVCDHDQ